MQRAMSTTGRRLRLLAVAVVTAVAALAATAAGASAASSPCGPTDPRICVQNVGTPGTVSPSTALFPTFVSYKVTVTNRAPSTATHVTLEDGLPVGTKLKSGTSDAGTCTSAPAVDPTVVTCALGSLASGVTATVTIVVEAPQGEGTVTNKATATFDEGPNDAPNGGKQDTTATVPEDTIVDALLGAAVSLVPSGEEVRIDTSPTHAASATPDDRNIGKALVPASTHDPLTASLNEDSDIPFICPKKQICRSGAWVHAVIPGTFAPPDELQFELHWSKVLVPKQQTVKNLAVFYLGDCLVTCPAVITISARCSSPTPPLRELPCLTDVGENALEFHATLHSNHNGRMR